MEDKEHKTILARITKLYEDNQQNKELVEQILESTIELLCKCIEPTQKDNYLLIVGDLLCKICFNNIDNNDAVINLFNKIATLGYEKPESKDKPAPGIASSLGEIFVKYIKPDNSQQKLKKYKYKFIEKDLACGVFYCQHLGDNKYIGFAEDGTTYSGTIQSPKRTLPILKKDVFYDEKNMQTSAIYIDELGHIYRRQKNKRSPQATVTNYHLSSKWLKTLSMSESDRIKLYQEFLELSNTGEGKFIHISGETFNGKWDYFFNTADGVYTKGTLRYEGSMRYENYAFDGHGVCTDGNMVYTGSFENGKRHGEGILLCDKPDQKTYCLGKFMDDEFTSGAKYTKTRNNGEISQIIELGIFLSDDIMVNMMDNNIKIEIDAINKQIKVTQKIEDENLGYSKEGIYNPKELSSNFLDWLLERGFAYLGENLIKSFIKLASYVPKEELPAITLIKDSQTVYDEFIAYEQSPSYDLFTKQYNLLNDNHKSELLNTLKLSPNSTVTMNLLGCICIKNDNFTDAERYLMQAIARQDNYARILLISFCNIKKEFDKAMKLIPIDQETIDVETQMYIGDLFLKQGKTLEAKEWLLGALDNINTTPQQDQNNEKYTKLKTKILRLLGELTSEESELKADNQYLRSASEHGDIFAQVILGCVYLSQDKCNEAEVLFYKAARSDSFGQHHLGVCLSMANKLNAAKWILRAAIDGYDESQREVGKIYLNNKEYNKACLWLLGQAKKGDARAQCLLGEAYYQLKRMDEAEVWCRKAADQDHAPAYNMLGQLYIQKKEYKGAEYWLRKSDIKKEPSVT